MMTKRNEEEVRRSYRKRVDLLTTNDERDERTRERENGKLKDRDLKK